MKRFLSALYRHWTKFARILGRIQTTIILVLIYVLVFGSTRLVLWLGRKDLLGKRRPARSSYWIDAEADHSPARSLRQF